MFISQIKVREVLSCYKMRNSLTGWFLHKNPIQILSPKDPPTFRNYERYIKINNDDEPVFFLVLNYLIYIETING